MIDISVSMLESIAEAESLEEAKAYAEVGLSYAEFRRTEQWAIDLLVKLGKDRYASTDG